MRNYLLALAMIFLSCACNLAGSTPTPSIPPQKPLTCYTDPITGVFTCGNGTSGSGTSGSGSSSGSSTVTPFDVSLVPGTWKSNCVYFSGSGPMQSMRELLTFSGTTFTVLDIFYSDSCTTEYSRLTWLGTFSIGGSATIVSGSTTMRKIDTQQTSMTLTPVSVGAVIDYNTASTCGVSSWTNGVAKPVAGLNCFGSVNPTNGTWLYNIIDVENSNLMYLGTGGSSTTTAGRPTMQDFSTQYSKQ